MPKARPEISGSPRLAPVVRWLLLFALYAAVAGCDRSHAKAPASDPIRVTVSYPLERQVTDYQDYTGRTAAVDSVQIQARVTGYLSKVYFKEGEEVAEGMELYEIDPRPYQDAYDAAKAQVEQNEASLELAQQNNKRFKTLAKQNLGAVSQTDLDQYRSQENQARANLDRGLANLKTAELDLEWTKVTAPVVGRVGRLLVTRGNLIVANQTTLTSVVRQDPMWVYFDMDEQTWLQVGELARQGEFGPASPEKPPKIPFHLQLANEKDFPHEATLDFVNNQLDQGTATLLIRAVFANPKPPNGPRVFAPNMFVRVRVPTSAPYRALLINPEAVGTDQDLKYVYIVAEDNKVVRHNVKLGTLQDGLQVVSEGLDAGERVIVKGVQRVREDAVVTPTLVPMAAPGAAPQAAAPEQSPSDPAPKQ